MTSNNKKHTIRLTRSYWPFVLLQTANRPLSKKPRCVIVTTISMILSTRAILYLALLELLNPSESEDNPPLFFRLTLPLVAGDIYFPVLISFYSIANPSTYRGIMSLHNTVTFSPGLGLCSRSLNSARSEQGPLREQLRSSGHRHRSPLFREIAHTRIHREVNGSLLH